MVFWISAWWLVSIKDLAQHGLAAPVSVNVSRHHPHHAECGLPFRETNCDGPAISAPVCAVDPIVKEIAVSFGTG